MSWDSTFESNPDDTDEVSGGDDKIRELKVFTRKGLAVVIEDTSGNAIGSGADMDNLVINDSILEGTTIVRNAGNKIDVADDGIKASHVDWGSSSDQVDMDDVPDSTSYQKVAADYVGSSGEIDKIKDTATFDTAVTRYYSVNGYDGWGTPGSGRDTDLADDQAYPVHLPEGAVVTGVKGVEASSVGNDDYMRMYRVDEDNSTTLMASAQNENWDTSISAATIDNQNYCYYLQPSYTGSGAYGRGIVRYTVARPGYCG